MQILLGSAPIASMFTTKTALSFLVFTLLYTPCVAAIATVRRELGSGKAAAATVLIQCVIAWVMAFLVRCVGLALGFA